MFSRFKPKSEFRRNVLTLMTGATIAQAISITISPILTRIYTPEDFGVLALYVAMVSIFASIGGGRYDYAIILPEKEEEAVNVFALSFVILVLFSMVLLLVVILFNEEITSLFKSDEIGFWLYFIPISVFFTALFNFLTFYNNRDKNYKDIAMATVIKSFILVTVQLIIGFIKGGVVGLISGQIVSTFFANMKLLKNIIQTEFFLSKISIDKMILVAKKYKKFPKYQMPNAILNTFSSHIPIFIFSSFFLTSIVGFYSLATRILFAPLMIISSANSKVYNQSVTEIYNRNGDSYTFTISFLISLLKKIIVPFVLIVLFAPQLFSFIFGEVWREAGIYTQILSPYILLNVMVSSVAFIAFLLQQQKKSLILSIIHTLLSLIAIFIGIYFDNIYISLALYMFVSSMILIYNLVWMLTILKKDVYDKKNIE